MLDLITGSPVHMAVAGLFGLLAVASLVTFMLRRNDTENKHAELSARVKSWWFMIALFSFAMVTSPLVSVFFFAFLSFLALREFISIVPLRRADRRVLFWAYLTIPVQYAFVADDWYGMFIVFIPVWVFFLMPFRLILAGQMQGFLNSVATISWGLMITVFAVSHAAMLTRFPVMPENLAGGAGLMLFLFTLNQGNDVAQYVWGKLFGKHKILPLVSPKKTWEGFLGGALTTMIAALIMAPFLTPFSTPFALFIGAVIAAAGFIGDVTFSALKRDLGIKDTGALIPGHGGILDRIDSLSLTAPLFFHLVRYFYY